MARSKQVKLTQDTNSEELDLWMQQTGLVETGTDDQGEWAVYTPLGLRLTLTMFAALLEQIGVDRDEVYEMLDPLNVSYKIKAAIVKGNLDVDSVIATIMGVTSDSETE